MGLKASSLNRNNQVESINDFIYPIDQDDVRIPIKSIIKDQINWFDAFQQHVFREEDLEKFKIYIDWKALSLFHTITPQFYIKYMTRLDHHNLSRNKKLSIDTIKTIDELGNYYFNSATESRTFTSYELNDLIRWLDDKGKKYTLENLLKYQNVLTSTLDYLMSKNTKSSSYSAKICRYQPLNADFVRTYENEISFKNLSYNRNICVCVFNNYKTRLLKSEEMELVSRRQCECHIQNEL